MHTSVSFSYCIVDVAFSFSSFSRRASERTRIAKSLVLIIFTLSRWCGAWAYATRRALAYQPEAVPQAVRNARARARKLTAISLPHSLSRYTGRRRRSKSVSYGGLLNTGWRVKSVIKIINGSSVRAFSYRRSTARPRGASVKGNNTQRSFSPRLPSSLLFPSSLLARHVEHSILFLLSFFIKNLATIVNEIFQIWKDIDVRW